MSFFWHIWWQKNQVVHSAAMRCDENIIGWASNFIGEFRSANVTSLSRSCLCRPEVCNYKVNIDAVVNGPLSCISIGIMIRNHHGLVMGSSIQSITTCFSPQVAEAVALLPGFRFAIDSGLLPIFIEFDAKAVVELDNAGVIIGDILL
ncbi:hypothetical protein Dsin_022668 [Dipteronia sinensis]|uniref:RNase H type-1 domain-containing protein n=1 Tax=Dipteronia sinensis TaxID=43782 RepID=A0AAE0E012_9ROSI|nr:hypothetical protein Dsin_022668 [Dipteronia sinensis]